MRKEILLAIIVGIVAGLGVTYAIYTVRQTMMRSSTPSEIELSRQQEVAPTDSPAATNLSIKQPTPDFLTDQDNVQVVGKALPESYIVVLSPSGEHITTADRDGDFAVRVGLVEGGNRLTVVATTPDGDQEELVMTAVYITEPLDQPEEEGDDEEGDE